MTLKYSGKSFRKVVWKTDQEIWARLHEEAWRSFGGCCLYVVIDNLKEGVIRPDIYEPELNPVYAAMLRHYGVVADPCRVGDPDRKGTVENAIQHTQGTALKGRRFDSIEAQNTWLTHWEAGRRRASTAVRNAKVLEMFREERHTCEHCRWRIPLLKAGTRTVDDAGLVQVNGSIRGCPLLRSKVQIRPMPARLRSATACLLRRHAKGEQGFLCSKSAIGF
jgi:hypothetical protein